MGRLRAPGMCPATGSTGSLSPRNRSAARASSSTPCRASEAAAVASRTGIAPGRPEKSPAPGLLTGSELQRLPGRAPGVQTTVEHRHVGMAVVAQQPPCPRRGQSTGAVIDDHGHGRRTRRRPASRPRTRPDRGAGDDHPPRRVLGARRDPRPGRRTRRRGCARPRTDRAAVPERDPSERRAERRCRKPVEIVGRSSGPETSGEATSPIVPGEGRSGQGGRAGRTGGADRRRRQPGGHEHQREGEHLGDQHDRMARERIAEHEDAPDDSRPRWRRFRSPR